MRGDDKGKEGKIIRVLSEDGPRDDRGRQHREEASQGAHGRGAERHHRDAGADPRVERHAARSEERRADARRAAQIDEDGTKERISVKSGEAIPRTR